MLMSVKFVEPEEPTVPVERYIPGGKRTVPAPAASQAAKALLIADRLSATPVGSAPKSTTSKMFWLIILLWTLVSAIIFLLKHNK